MKRDTIKILVSAICVCIGVGGIIPSTFEAYGDTLSNENVKAQESSNNIQSESTLKENIKDDTSSNENEEDSDDTSSNESEEDSDDKQEENSSSGDKEDTSEESEQQESELKIIKRINSGLGTLEDYETLGINSVTEENITDVNWYLKRYNASNKEKVQSNVNILITALGYVNGGTTQISYYVTLGVDHINAENAVLAEQAVINAKGEKNSELTRTEIVDAFNKDVYEPFSRIVSAKGTVEDYKILKIADFEEEYIEDVNWYIGKNPTTSLSAINSNVTTIINALEAINEGDASSGSYKVLGIDNVDAETKVIANKAVLEAKSSKGKNLTREEIIAVVEENIDKYINKINEGEAELEDYAMLGLTSVNADNIKSINNYLKNQDSSTLAKIKNNINKVVISIQNINNGTLSMDFYNIAGITGVCAERDELTKRLILEAKAQKGSDLTVAEIQKVIDDKIADPLNRINSGTGTLDDYAIFNIKSVTEDNLKDINWYMSKNKNNTAEQIQTNVDTFLNALKEINNGSTKVEYYTTIGADKIIAGNVGIAKNYILKAKEAKGENLTREEIVKIANENVGDPMAKIQRGEGSVADYEALGIKCVTEDVLEDVNWINTNKDYDNSTVVRIDSNCQSMVNSLKNINNGTTKLDYYKVLGLKKEVTTDNAQYMQNIIINKANEKGKNLSRTEIIDVVNEGIIFIDKTIKNICEGKASVEEYTKLYIEGVTSNNVKDINWKESIRKPSTIAEVRRVCDETLKALRYVNNATKYTYYYIYLGMDDVDEDNVEYVKSAMAAARASKESDLNRIEMKKVADATLVKVNQSLEKIKTGKAEISDYEFFKITKVTSNNLADVNWYVSNNVNDTLSNIKNSVNKIVNALNTINKGTTSISYYKTLGITSVNSSNASTVKKAIVEARTNKGSYLTKNEIVKVVSKTIA